MSVNPFDIKTILLAKHAQHVGLLGVAVVSLTGHVGGFVSGVNGPG
jgi:hypothetical protein